MGEGRKIGEADSHRRALLILDGLEPLQNPPGPQEGRVRDPSLQALVRELAAFNAGLCVITTRLPVADVADQAHLSPAPGPRATLQRCRSKGAPSLGVKGNEAELRSASDELAAIVLP